MNSAVAIIVAAFLAGLIIFCGASAIMDTPEGRSAYCASKLNADPILCSK